MRSEVIFGEQERERGQLGQQSLATARSLFLAHGYLYIEDVFERAFVRKLARAYSDAYTERGLEWLEAHTLKVGEQRYMISVDIGGVFNDPQLYAHPLLHAILADLLGADFVMNSFGSVVALSGSPQQHRHLDHAHLADEPEVFGRLPPYGITVVIPLVDLDERTGTTALYEGSTRVRLNDPGWFRAHPPVHPYPRLGGVYLMDYRMLHYGTPNQSEAPRPILYLVYSRPWFVDVANYTAVEPLKMRRTDYERIPDQHKGLFSRARPSPG